MVPNPTRIRFANAAMDAFSGAERSDLMAMGPHQLATLIHDQDRDRFTAAFERLLLDGAGEDGREYRLVRRDASVVWARSWATRIEAEGQPAAMIVFVDDTERRHAVDEMKQTHSKLLQAQHITPIGDFTWDTATGTVTWSDGMYRLLKYDPDEEIDLARVNTEVHHPDDLERVTAWLDAGIVSGAAVLEPNE